MFVRVAIAARSSALLQRVRQALRSSVVSAEADAVDDDLYVAVAARRFDLLVVESDRLGRRPAAGLAKLLEHDPRLGVVVLTEEDDAERRAELIVAGCLASLPVHLSDGALRDALGALAARWRDREVVRLRADPRPTGGGPDSFVTDSPAMRQVVALATKVARSDATLLLLGETGVGKEWLARAVHAESKRARGPFIAVNCAALPEQLLESELFGHEAGAYTGALTAKRGRFELAHGGTLFLDEIGDVPRHLQVKLLRVLQEHEVQRLGSEIATRVDVRVMAATNRNLTEAIAAGDFRADLYYRLGVVSLTIPPLRERVPDVARLVHTNLRRAAETLGSPVETVEPDALRALERYPWPGNVRELMNVVERAVLLAEGRSVTCVDLPQEIVGWAQPAVPGAAADAPGAGADVGARVSVGSGLCVDSGMTLRAAREQAVTSFERAYLEQLLRLTQGRVGEAAERAGLDPRSLYDKMRRHGLLKETYRVSPPPRPQERVPHAPRPQETVPHGQPGSAPDRAAERDR